MVLEFAAAVFSLTYFRQVKNFGDSSARVRSLTFIVGLMGFNSGAATVFLYVFKVFDVAWLNSSSPKYAFLGGCLLSTIFCFRLLRWPIERLLQAKTRFGWAPWCFVGASMLALVLSFVAGATIYR